MERTLLETIQSLGLDVQLGIILLLFAIDGLAMQGRRMAAWYAAQARRPVRSVVVAEPPASHGVEAWSPTSLSEIGGTAA